MTDGIKHLRTLCVTVVAVATKTRSVRLDETVWAALDETARSMRLNANVVVGGLVAHWLRLADENRDAAARLITRPELNLRQHLAALEAERGTHQ